MRVRASLRLLTHHDVSNPPSSSLCPRPTSPTPLQFILEYLEKQRRVLYIDEYLSSQVLTQ